MGTGLQGMGTVLQGMGTGLQGMGTVSASWTNVAPVTVARTTPGLGSGTLAAGQTSLDVNFSSDVNGGGDVVNFELRRQGPDGVLGNGDDDLVILNAAYASNTTTLSFTGLADGVYRLTVKASILSTAGFALDGDGDGVAGGEFVRDFVVGALSTALTSPNGFQFDPEFGGFGAGQLVHGTANAFDGLNRLYVLTVPRARPPASTMRRLSASTWATALPMFLVAWPIGSSRTSPATTTMPVARWRSRSTSGRSA